MNYFQKNKYKFLVIIVFAAKILLKLIIVASV